MTSKNPPIRTGGWTAASRRKLTGIRAPHTEDPKQFTLTGRQAWAKLTALGFAEGEAPTVLDPEVERARWARAERTMPYPQKHHTCSSKALMGFWVHTGGLQAPLELMFPNADDVTQACIPDLTDGKAPTFMAALRRYLFAASDEDFKAAKEAFSGRYAQLAACRDYKLMKIRDLCAFAFSRDPEWLEELLEAHYAAPGKHGIITNRAVLGGITDPQAALAYVKTWSSCSMQMGPWAHDLVESLDGDAVPVLEHLVGLIRGARDRKPIQAALKVAYQLGPKAAAPAAAQSEVEIEIDLPASLASPFDASQSAKKVKRPRKVPMPDERITLTAPAGLAAAIQAKLEGTHMPEAQVKEKVAELLQPQDHMYKYYGVWRQLTALPSHGLLSWLEAFDPKILSKVMRGRNAPKALEVFGYIVVPFAHSAPELVSRVVVGFRPEVLVGFADWAHSPAIVARLSEVAHAKKSAEKARAWLQAHPELALSVLVPAAVNASGKALAAHVASLSALAGANGSALNEAIAALPADAAAYLRGQLGTAEAIARPSSIPIVWSAAALPRLIHTESKQALPAAVMKEIGAMMVSAPASAPMPGIQAMTQLTTAESRRELGTYLYEAWKKSGCDPKGRWALDYCGVLAGDSLAETLAADLLGWAQRGDHQRAFWAVDVLASLATDRAARALWSVERDNRYNGLTSRARDGLERIAAARGISADELHDELVPTLELELGQRFTFDFGPRQFQGQILPDLRVRICDDEGVICDGLPRPRKADDGTKASSAKASLTALNKQLRKVRTLQPARMERAMTERRRWSSERFSRVLLTHPLMAFVAQGVLWGRYDNQHLIDAFRIDEERQAVDAHDVPVDLAGATVGVVHPAELDADARAQWSQVFADYVIVQPFDQLGREVVVHPEAETELMALEGRTAKPGRVLGLLRRGWSRGPVEDAGIFYSVTRGAVSLGFDPGLTVGVFADAQAQTLTGLQGYEEALGAIAISELVADLRWLVADE